MGTSRSKVRRPRTMRASAVTPAPTGETATDVLDDADAQPSEGQMPDAGAEIVEPPPHTGAIPSAASTADAGSRDHLEDQSLIAVIRRIPRERAWWIAATSVLAIAALVMLVLVNQMVGVTGEWQDRSEEIDAANYALGEEIATERESVATLTAKNELLTQQLDTAKARISELADQSANADDDAAYAAQQVELLSGYVSSATSVANALGRCVDGQTQLVEYLKNADDYEPAELDAYEASVVELCTAAQNANAALQDQLNG